jgi:putative redox protein
MGEAQAKGVRQMSEAVTIRTSETGESPFAVEITLGSHRLTGDEPPGAGGGGLGPSPYEVLAAALGECTSMTVRWFAQQQNWPVEHIAVEVSHHQDKIEGAAGVIDVFVKTVAIGGDALTAEQRDRLMMVAARCPVHRTLEHGSQITTQEG